MDIVLVAAVARNGVIGRDGGLPWRIKSDMQRFRTLTWGKPTVVGRKTYFSFTRKPLPGRTNIVVTRAADLAVPGAIVVPSLIAALDVARGDALRRGTDSIMVLGGADIYGQAMPLANRLEVTHIHAECDGDTVFPDIDPAIWREAARIAFAPGPGDDTGYDAVTYVRIRPLTATAVRDPAAR
ncbi:MAG TPA: dihydrofolate reductase [Xanthobacteraceae bacterium]|jgi:dihydrofolate reductase